MKADKSKSGFGIFIFIGAVVAGAFLLQLALDTQVPRVSFGHQVEHLVNLELVDTGSLKKSATSDNLVNFEGQFKETIGEGARTKFAFVEHIHRINELNKAIAQEQSAEKKLQERCFESAAASIWLFDESVPSQGLGIATSSSLDFLLLGEQVSEKTLAPFFITLMPEKMSEYSSKGAKKLKSTTRYPQLQTTYSTLSMHSKKDDLVQLLQGTKLFLEDLIAPPIALSSKDSKELVQRLLTQIQLVLDKGIDDKTVTNGSLYQLLKESFEMLKNVKQGLFSLEDGLRFSTTRSLREYKNHLATLRARLIEIVEIERQMQRVQLDPQTRWYFGDKELSSQQLANLEPEEYSVWFYRAQAEWEAFASNKGKYFKAVDQSLTKALGSSFRSEELPPNYNAVFMIGAVIIMALMVLYSLFARQMKGMGGGAMSFGKSPARLLQKGTKKITFKDVAGIDEAKEELEEIVSFLKNKDKFTKLGAEIPKGVLCVGPPGTGKTLIAKAVAGEANRPFFAISGSDFVEMFVGVGASRIRDMFKEAKKQAPCIIFIDEIDAVGRHRGSGASGGHDEREQTLNQLLVEMDGFDGNQGIILMAATNRPDVLDKALLRPGRFDRRVVIDLPDIKGREEILKIHAKKVKLGKDVDLHRIARATPGASGADLKNILNEAALASVRHGDKDVSQASIAEATDKVRYGKERKSFELTKESLRATAYHEAGHAVVAMALKSCDPVDKVTIIPRGMALGATYTLPKTNRTGFWKKELHELMAMLLGGRCAEEMFVGDLSSGASSDIQRATQYARSMVCEWGMSSNMGAVCFSEPENSPFSEGSLGSKKYSDSTAQQIDREVKELITEAKVLAEKVLSEHTEQLELMAQMLIEFETLEHTDVEKIMDLSFSVKEKKKLVATQEKKKGSRKGKSVKKRTNAESENAAKQEGVDQSRAQFANRGKKLPSSSDVNQSASLPVSSESSRNRSENAKVKATQNSQDSKKDRRSSASDVGATNSQDQSDKGDEKK